MILTHLAVTDVRGISRARFGPFSDRLNLLYGPNESGKSTLVEALRFGLFERSSGEAEHKRELRSWGGTGAPEIEVGFLDDQGDPWTVYKRFLDRPSTELAGANTTLRGEEAERRLRELMGTRPGNRLGVTDADLGIWPLLWVRQGEAGRTAREAVTDDARQKLSHTLAATTGEIAVGAVGRDLLERARALAAASWTELDKPRGAWKTAIEEHQAAERRVADLEEQAARQAQLVREVDELQVELDGLGRRRARLAESAASLGERARAAAELHVRLAALEPRTALARLEHDEAERRLADRDQREQERAAVEAAAEATRAALARDEATLERLSAEQAALRHEVIRAARDAAAAQQVVSRVLLRRERDALARQHQELVARIADAVALEQRVASLLHAVAAARVSPDAVDKLEATLRDADRARARLDAIAVAVRVTAVVDQRVDGVVLPAGTTVERRAVDALTLVVGGAQIEVVPGGDLSARRAEVEELDRRAQRALDALGVADLTAARRRLDEQRSREVELKGLRDRLAALAPGGIGPLEAEAAALAEKISLGGDAADLPDYARAEGAARLADAHTAELRARAEIADSSRQAVILAVAEHRSALRAATTDLARVDAKLQATPPRAALLEETGRTAGALGALLTERDALTRAWTAAGGEAIAREHTAEEAALAGMDARYAELRDRVLRAQAAAGQVASTGLYSALQDARDALWDAAAQVARLEREAVAARALASALTDARRGLEERFSAPVRAVIAPWVDTMFPGSELAIDPDSGHVIGIRTGRTVERFEDLSAGARDQLAILVRLGVARVIAGPGRLPVLLDDALVNADDRRRQRMLDVLRQASAHLQVLVFTCHDAEFDRLGADWTARVAGRAARG